MQKQLFRALLWQVEKSISVHKLYLITLSDNSSTVHFLHPCRIHIFSSSCYRFWTIFFKWYKNDRRCGLWWIGYCSSNVDSNIPNDWSIHNPSLCSRVRWNALYRWRNTYCSYRKALPRLLQKFIQKTTEISMSSSSNSVIMLMTR